MSLYAWMLEHYGNVGIVDYSTLPPVAGDDPDPPEPDGDPDPPSPEPEPDPPEPDGDPDPPNPDDPPDPDDPDDDEMTSSESFCGCSLTARAKSWATARGYAYVDARSLERHAQKEGITLDLWASAPHEYLAQYLALLSGISGEVGAPIWVGNLSATPTPAQWSVVVWHRARPYVVRP